MMGVREMEHSFLIFVGISQPLVTCHKGMQLVARSQAVAFTRSLEVED